MRVYMVGIGGIGMSALAQLYHARGETVSGSDREASPATELLTKKGIRVHIGEDARHVPAATELLVYSDAVPKENAERATARGAGIPELSYFEAAGKVSKDRFTIAVAGSHGKTTTTALLEKILHDTGYDPTAIVGSMVKDFGSNFLAGSTEGPFVIEACEYQNHLLKLSPNILVVTNLEWDHTDYFKDFDALKKTFRQAIFSLPADGVLVTNMSDPVLDELSEHAKCAVVDYADASVPELKLLGGFNEMNARAAKTAAAVFAEGISEKEIDASLAEFQGTWRRFEHKGQMPRGAAVYDDYAHHPSEITATLTAIREKFPEKKIVVAFHPHLFSRTRDLMDDFAASFSAADTVIIAPIYAAREEPIEGVTSAVLAEKISAHGVDAQATNSLEQTEGVLHTHDAPGTLVVTMGAGDIHKIADRLVRR